MAFRTTAFDALDAR